MKTFDEFLNERSNKAFITWESYPEEDCYLISHLWVPVSERRKGKARKLLRNAIREMKAEGKHNLIKLSADSVSEDPENSIDTQDLVDFYESEGFNLDYVGEIVVMSMSI